MKGINLFEYRCRCMLIDRSPLKDRTPIEGLYDEFGLKEPGPVDRLSGFLLPIDEKECTVPCLRCASCHTPDDNIILCLFGWSPVFVLSLVQGKCATIHTRRAFPQIGR